MSVALFSAFLNVSSWVDVPTLGTWTLCGVLVLTAHAFSLSVMAGRGRPHLLTSARLATLATCALVAVALFLLAYAFQTHDFRIRYVARYSDRSMPWYYLVTSLWGGQDGSLLWWSFLLCGWTTACVLWMRNRFLALQPWVLATLMAILAFFVILMLWSANPFALSWSAEVPADGDGLNPLLQNYWMTIHPPTLYMGFIGWSIPFAFAMAALFTGRLHEEWLHACRRWVLAVWLFLSCGLLLGALWSYEELGWGGYWAWDPVENASFMPWLVGTAFLHSMMVQERYAMLKVWNLFLICLTFFMTIFGTFLTRAGLISSVHSFAKSDIGVYFVGFMAVIIVACMALILWRLPKLKSDNRIESMVSREFAFLLNNWILLAMMGFVLILTTFPLITEFFQGEQVTVGPPVYNRWMVPFGIVLLVLSGIGPLMAWRRATQSHLLRAFLKPSLMGLGVGLLHFFAGPTVGLPGWVASSSIYETATGDVLAAIASAFPMMCTAGCAFVLATIFQEFWRGIRARVRNTATRGQPESLPTAMVRLIGKSRRRYGGYIVHVGIVCMYLGFTGAAYDIENEAALLPGETMNVADYTIRYDRPRMATDGAKHMAFADLTLLKGAAPSSLRTLGTLAPAKFVYRTHPDMPTTEVDIRSRLFDDVYAILSTIDPKTRRATIRVVVRPLVMWIWLGGLILILGTVIAMSPTVQEVLARNSKRAPPRNMSAAKGVAASTIILFAAFLSPALARAQDTSSLHAGSVSVHTEDERVLFERTLCMCGDCARLTLATCGCSWAEDKRQHLRQAMARGSSVQELLKQYREEHGVGSLSVPSDEGLSRALWAAPIGGGILALGGLLWVGRRWTRRRKASDATSESSFTPATGDPGDTGDPSDTGDPDAYDQQLDRELEG